MAEQQTRDKQDSNARQEDQEDIRGPRDNTSAGRADGRDIPPSPPRARGDRTADSPWLGGG